LILNPIKKNISVILLGLFIFPFVFQFVHVLVRHSHQHCCGSVCQITVLPIGSTINMVAPVEKQPVCPVCEYHFPINNLPKLHYFAVLRVPTAAHFTDFSITIYHAEPQHRKSPRAPPSSVLITV
jgi:hypothetical protein